MAILRLLWVVFLRTHERQSCSECFVTLFSVVLVGWNWILNVNGSIFQIFEIVFLAPKSHGNFASHMSLQKRPPELIFWPKSAIWVFFLRNRLRPRSDFPPPHAQMWLLTLLTSSDMFPGQMIPTIVSLVWPLSASRAHFLKKRCQKCQMRHFLIRLSDFRRFFRAFPGCQAEKNSDSITLYLGNLRSYF